MAKKQAKAQLETPVTGDIAELLGFWREIVKGRIVVKDEDNKSKEIIVPLEVRIRASELLAKHVIPKGGKLVEEDDDAVSETTPDILALAQALENRANDQLLEQAFNAVRARKKP